LLDEPTASLDLGHQQQLMQRVRDFAAQGVAVLLVLHDLNLALSFADRLLVLQEGRLIADGLGAEVLSPELLRRLFGASAELFHHPRTGRPIVLL
jgi:iron complex transport system ATP-binding protein